MSLSATLPTTRRRVPAEPRSAPAPSPAVGWLSLLAGTVLLILGQHGNPDIGVAGWVYAILLLRFTRSVRLVPAMLVIAAVHALAGVIWVISIRLPTDGIPWPAIIGAAVLNILLAIPFLIDRLIAVPLRMRHALLASLVYPTARVGAELLMHTISPYGKVTGSLAGGQHDNLALLQLASVTGAYGVSFLMAWFGSAACELWQRPHRLLPIGVCAGIIAAVTAAGAVRLIVDQPTDDHRASSVRIAGITPSRSVEDVSAQLPETSVIAADPQLVTDIMEPVTTELLQRTDQQSAAGAQIVVWSEAATIVHEDRLDDLLDQVAAVARQNEVYVDVAVGMVTRQPPHTRNLSILIGPDGSQLFSYDKVHPVPGMESSEPGTEPPQVVDTALGRLAGMICYDLDYADTASTRADIVLLPSSDWPGFDRLHTETAQLWAVEQGYSVFRQDNQGTAAAFDSTGRTLARADYYSTEAQTMVAQVPTTASGSVYARVGNLFSYLCVAGLIALIVAGLLSRRHRPVPADDATSGRN